MFSAASDWVAIAEASAADTEGEREVMVALGGRSKNVATAEETEGSVRSKPFSRPIGVSYAASAWVTE